MRLGVPMTDTGGVAGHFSGSAAAVGDRLAGQQGGRHQPLLSVAVRERITKRQVERGHQDRK